MDTALSNADASFIGEDAFHGAGGRVSNAGDVNRDGYDDFLIGAEGDAKGGYPKAGQAYLILGKASWWSMDTDLSDADASFIGEEAGDRAGCSVSGVGDVNGDGYDDFLIGAFGKEGGGHRSDAGVLSSVRPDQVSLNDGKVPKRVESELPTAYRLGQNYPNPFNSETLIPYDVAKAGAVRLRVYASTGQKVRTLVDGESRSAGSYSVLWDGRDDAGRDVASGVYLCRMEGGEYRGVRRMLLVREWRKTESRKYEGSRRTRRTPDSCWRCAFGLGY